MGEIVVAEHVDLPCSVSDAFHLIASGGVPAWRVPPGSRLRVGVPISIAITLPSGLGGQQTDILGRVVRLEHPGLLVIAHELPWRGRITLKVRPGPDDTSRVRMTSSIDEDVIRWSTRLHASVVLSPRSTPVWRLGLLSSASGPASVYSVATRSMATLAVEEINASGGVLGRTIELVHGDDGSHPGLGAAELVRLRASGCDVVLANVTSAVFRKLLPVARRQNLLLVHTLINEGGASGVESFRLGERPPAQAAAAIPALMHSTGGGQFFLAGNDYCWPRAMLRSAKRVIHRSGGTASDEHYLPFGTTDFTSLIESIDRSGAELVVSTFVGADEVAFEQQMHSTGMATKTRTVSFTLDESTHEYIGPVASAGLWTVFSYFQALQSPENLAFLSRYRARFGADAPPVSSMTECVYEAVNLVARAAIAAGDVTPAAVGGRLRDGVSYTGPRGLVEVSSRGVRQPMYVAQSIDGTLQTLDPYGSRTG